MAELVDTNSATAKASDILQGETAYVKSGMVTGTIPIQAGSTVVPSTASKTAVERGVYMGGDIVMVGDANLKPENIKKDVTMFGVKGTWEGEPPSPGLPEGFYEITAESSNPEAGSVLGGGVASKGMAITVKSEMAEDNASFEFSEWRKDGEPVSGSEEYTFKVFEPCNLVAYYTKSVLEWFVANKLPQTYMKSITYGEENSVFVSVGGTTTSYPNNAMYSTDGITWTISPISATTALYWYDVAYGDGYFVAVGYPSSGTTNIFAYSSTGKTWTSTTWGSNYGKWECIAYGNGKFVVLQSDSSSNKFMYSTSSIPTTSSRWSLGTLPIKGTWNGIAYGNNMFVAVGNNYGIYSIDGIEWSENTNLPSASCITFGAGKFVAIKSNGNTAYCSNNGIDWETHELPFSATATSPWSGVAYGNGYFVAVAGGSSGSSYDKIAVSKDGVNWKASALPTALRLVGVTYGDGKFVAITGDNSYNAIYGIVYNSSNL